jgi:hypothetical protein
MLQFIRDVDRRSTSAPLVEREASVVCGRRTDLLRSAMPTLARRLVTAHVLPALLRPAAALGGAGADKVALHVRQAAQRWCRLWAQAKRPHVALILYPHLFHRASSSALILPFFELFEWGEDAVVVTLKPLLFCPFESFFQILLVATLAPRDLPLPAPFGDRPKYKRQKAETEKHADGYFEDQDHR